MTRVAALLCLSWAVCGCRTGTTTPWDEKLPKTIHVTSSAFEDGQPIPSKYTADGKDISPPIAWDNLPEGTQELVLICDDPDAPGHEPWVHWIVYSIPKTVTELAEGMPTPGLLPDPANPVQESWPGTQGLNSWTSGVKVGYRGPAPPPGSVHHYRFRVYALNASLNLKDEADKQRLLNAMTHCGVLAWGELVGTYQR
jgi:Raf kinase inhibitor-like YbhB/YbcL family protein